MKFGVGLFACAAILALMAVSVWATGHQAIAPALADLFGNPVGGNNPWFIATLFDAYFAFLWFWLWVAYKETSWLLRGTWLVLILLMGNMAMAAYVLIQLYKLPTGAGVEQLLLRARP